MSTPPLNLNPSKTSRASSKPIGSLATESKDALGLSSATTTSSSSSSLRTPKSSVSRKKPPGLDISRSIPSRAAPPNPGAPPNGTPASSRSNYHSKLSEQLAGLELADSKREKLDLKTEDLKVIGDLGAGNGGTVTKVIHAGTGLTMAKKLVLIDAKPSVRKQILRELQIMHECSSPYIVSFYGAFLADPHICICMECMDGGSLDGIYRKHGAVDIAIVGKIAESVLKGLIYLYDAHRIIHRDIKPSNILANSNGDIKICDFGVSGELVNSVANTFVGTSTYMSPERIQGANYTIKSDVWSLGISLVELALGRFPFSDAPDDDDDLEDPDATLPLSTQRPNMKTEKPKSEGVSLGGGGMTMSILDLLQHIVNEPAPRLTKGRYPIEAEDFVAGCLDKDPETRFAPKRLLESAWITNSTLTKSDLKAWAQTVA